MIAIKSTPKVDPVETDDPERYTALYDPDTVYPARLSETSVAESVTERSPLDGELSRAPLYAESEKRRAASPLSAEMVKRIADRAEKAARGKRRR